ncbi:hypothetical protein ACROYT_G020230 [Oculina patagonica]
MRNVSLPTANGQKYAKHLASTPITLKHKRDAAFPVRWKVLQQLIFQSILLMLLTAIRFQRYEQTSRTLTVSSKGMEFVEKVSPVNAPLEKSETCNVMFVYIHPEDCKNDTRRWLGVVSCTPGEATHSHGKPTPSKIPTMLEEQIVECVQSDFTKTAKDVQFGYGMSCMPAEESPVAANIDVINREVKKARVDPNLAKAYSIIQNYEAIVQGRVNKDAHKNRTSTDSELQDKTNFNDEADAYLCPYKVEHYLTDNLNAVFFLSRLMAKILANLDRLTAEAYQAAFSGIFKAVGKYYPQFNPKDCLQAVIVDYSDAQVQGLIQTVGQNKAFSVLKGCQVHWMRSVLRVTSRVCQSEDEQFLFKAIRRAIPLAETEEDVLKIGCWKRNVSHTFAH